ncbi:SusC/RagA family TonB-linked outer membrane protein [Dysgonomonas sp. HGC4]|uniref:SusC/RagA family TonB-linked outer membrane protein n=1 Tax=Dysgonomonas sp. HGC4 TaxID=1658009 RepID=UPI0006817C61|nr:TonB-dependent receptor [Dysgonomonas sp. HGC4]
MLIGISAQAQIALKGTVVDEKNEPMIGIGVVVKNTTIGTATDLDGKFSITVPDSKSVLVFSFIGYRTQEITVGSQKELHVTLKEDLQLLDEVVVVGYGTQKKVNVTGSVSVVNPDIIENRPITNVSQALQGVVPGLNFSVNSSNGGALNSSMNVNIRGSGTIGSGSKASPLILIDGIEGDMNSLNPNDIASISVLKDAASSSIYGARAAFGVILITTKTGKSGRTSVSYLGNLRLSSAIQVPNIMDSYKFAQYFNRAATNDGQSPVFSDEMMSRILAYQRGELKEGTTANPNTGRWRDYDGANANTDWFKEQYKSSVPAHEHNVSISGGGEKMTYLVSGNFLDQNGLIRHGGDNLKRYSINSRITAKLSDYVDLNYNVKWIRNDYDRPSYMTPLFYHNIARRWPTNPVYDNNGFIMDGMEVLQMKDGGRNREQKDELYNQIQFIFEPIKNWRIYTEGNIRTLNKFEHWDVLPIYGHDVKGEPFLASWDGRAAGQTQIYENAYKENFLTTNIYTDYTKDLESGHNFKVMGGFNAEVMKTRNVWGQKDGLISPEVPTLNTATQNQKTGGGYAEWAVAGFFGRLNYNYKERYMAEVNLRYDGSSRFLSDKRWTVFPSFSVGWNIAQEDFFGSLSDHISTLKLRGSWGQLGNMNTDAWYPFFQSMPIGTQSGGWIVDNGVRPNTSSAPGIVSGDMTWETVESWNIGLDWAALNNRLTGSFDYFKRTTKNMIGPAPQLPGILGTSVPKVNNSDMESYGFELEVGWRDKIGDFSYGARFVLADNQQKITRYPNETGNIDTWYTNKMDGTIWGYQTIGIAKSDAEMNAHLATLPNGGQNAIGSNWAAGDIMYKDINGDGKIDAGSSTLTDPGDRTIIGNSTPRFKYGLTLEAAWKGIDISIFFQGVAKRDYMLGGAYFWGATGGMWQSVAFKEHWDFFRPEGDPLGANLDAYYPRTLFSSGDKNQQTQSRYLQDASYLRLKNLQIGYAIPTMMSQKIGLQFVRIYMSGENLWTKSDISGVFDPELLGGDWGAGKTYPLQRTISFGVNVNF